jgi:hypothetical protein
MRDAGFLCGKLCCHLENGVFVLQD